MNSVKKQFQLTINHFTTLVFHIKKVDNHKNIHFFSNALFRNIIRQEK